jgi:PKD repeat protein
MRWTIPLLAFGLVLAGCSDTPDSTTSSTTSKTATGAGTTTAAATTGATTTGSGTTTGGPGGGNGTLGNRAPTATLEANVTSGAAPLDVSFTLGGSDEDGDNLTAELRIGDGEPVQVEVPGSHLHTFDAAGNHTVVLTVSDGNATATDELVITVGLPGSGPNLCNREPTEEAEGIYLFEGDGGTWVFLEDNDVPGLQVANTHPTSEAGADKDIGAYNVAWEGCENGDLMIF